MYKQVNRNSNALTPYDTRGLANESIGTHILAINIENEAGALSRVIGLFSARGFNIESLTVAPTEDHTLSRMTLVSTGSNEILEQITKQLNKLIEVVKVTELSSVPSIEREFMMVKVKAIGENREELKRVSDIFRGRIIEVSSTTYTIELTGDYKKLNSFLKLLDPAIIIETVRSGTVGITRNRK